VKTKTANSALCRVFSLSLIISFIALLVIPINYQAFANADICTGGSFQTLIVDGVTVEICLPFQPDYTFTPSNNELTQSASITKQTPFQQFLIYAVPYGLNAGSSELQIAETGISSSYLEKTRRLYDQEGELVVPAPPISIFDQSAQGLIEVKNVFSSEPQPHKQLNAIWILESGGRVWIIQYIEQGDFSSRESINGVVNELKTFFVTSPDLNVPSVSMRVSKQQVTPDLTNPPTLRTLSDLPFPSWWSGECNVNNHAGSYPLGGSFRGMKACGPLKTLFLVNFGVGNRQYEWQCAELSKRYLYLAFGIPPFSANGKDIVNNCPENSRLEKVTNGTPNKGPIAGDVISYNGTDAYGHTSVVSSSNIDSSGNGVITVVEQNSSANGIKSLPVSNWVVQSGSGVSGWLHQTECVGSCIPVTYRPNLDTYSTKPTYSWSRISGATSYTLSVVDKGTGANILRTTVSSTYCSSTTDLCSYTPGRTLLINTNYRWKVAAVNGSNSYAFSPWRIFTTKQGIDSSFNNTMTGWTAQPGSSWTDFYNSFVQTDGAANAYSSINNDGSFSSFTYEVRMKRVDFSGTGAPSGLIVRGTPTFDSLNEWDSGYKFLYSQDGTFSVWKRISGVASILQAWTPSPAIISNGWNTLKVTMDTDKMRFYINSTLVWSGTDSSLDTGMVGVQMYQTGTGMGNTLKVDWAKLGMSDYYK
jgi:hypothetical protein